MHYVDTDSIVTPTKFDKGKKLGELKLEYKITRSLFVKPKVYMLNDEIFKIKGVPKIKDGNEFFTMIRKEKFKYMKFCKIKEAIRRHKHFNEKIMVEKYLTLEDTKRKWPQKFNLNGLQESKPIELPLK